MDRLTQFISYMHIWLGSWTAANWYAFGGGLGAVLATIGVTAWVKRHHLKKTAQELAGHFVLLNVAFWGFLFTVADFVLTQGTIAAPLLPFLGTHWAQISGGAIIARKTALALRQWWTDRKNKKPLTAPLLPPAPDILPDLPENLWSQK